MSECRSCGAEVRWVRTEHANVMMPIDVKPAENGNLIAKPGSNGKIATTNIPEGYTGNRYISHFATCPNAKQHRKPKPQEMADLFNGTVLDDSGA